MLQGAERRKSIIQILETAARSGSYVTGTALSLQNHVSRQVIVQDIALLKAEGNDIISSRYGYRLNRAAEPEDQGEKIIVKVRHSDEEMEAEMNTVVDLGGIMENVFIYHRIYGKIEAPMNIRSRRDTNIYLERIRSGRSYPLKHVTNDYHYHEISAPSRDIIDEIVKRLKEQGFLVAIGDDE